MRAAKISQDASQPPITEVLPVRGVVQGPQRADSVMVALVILFPKAVAAICTALVKLVVRAMVAVFSRLLQEFWVELRHVFHQAFFAVAEIEEGMVSMLESWMGGPIADLGKNLTNKDHLVDLAHSGDIDLTALRSQKFSVPW